LGENLYIHEVSPSNPFRNNPTKNSTVLINILSGAVAIFVVKLALNAIRAVFQLFGEFFCEGFFFK